MYLKSLTMENFRKFGTKDNTVEFAAAKDYALDEKINIAPKITLIVGKNNSGKTTVTEALKRLLEQQTFKASDFNFNYLKRLLKSYTPHAFKSDNIKLPRMTFVLKIGIDNDSADLLTNIFPFITFGSINNPDITIKAEWFVEDELSFTERLKQLVSIKNSLKDEYFYRFLDLINDSKFSLTYKDADDNVCNRFSLKNLIEIEPIAANIITNDNCLSNAFTKIVDFRYKYANNGLSQNEFDKQIVTINDKLSKYIEAQHTQYINNALKKIISSDKCQVLLRSDLTFQKMLHTVVKYEYKEGDNHIPEQQFGLGYTNLMMIVANIISYMEKYPESAFNSHINLITIEEPETFMHPQMQELFIRYINQMVAALLEGKNKHVNTQIIITTHSAHILNSKIHEGNSFNNVDYITEREGEGCAVCLSDQMILPNDDAPPEKQEANLRYIKKHIIFGISELFFADAAIFVEGIAEQVLLKYYLSIDDDLKYKHLSIVVINGAFAHVYKKLIDALSIPVLIITDIDFKRSDQEKNDCTQITDELLANRTTTNTTLRDFYDTNSVADIISKGYIADGHCKIVCQQQATDGYYATSFEEAFVLGNCNNAKVREIVAEMLVKNVDDVTEQWIKSNSYRIQRSLRNKKSNFANRILYEILSDKTESFIPNLPAYILDGLQFLKEELDKSK